MRTIGVIMILVGGVLAVVNGRYMFRDERESKDFAVEYMKWMDKSASYYPRSGQWSDEDIFLQTVSQFCPMLFIGGCVLYGAGAISAQQFEQRVQQHKQHVHLCNWLKEIFKKLSKAPATTAQKSDSKDNSSDKHGSPPTTSESKQPQQNHLASAPNQTETVEVLPEATVIPAKGHPQQSAPNQTEQLVDLVPYGLPVSSNASVQLSSWWPSSPTGITLLCIMLVVSFFASTAVTGEPISGIVSAGLWYLIVILVRYFAVVAPSQK